MKNAVIILILAFTLLFIGCRNNEDQKLIGVWKEIPFVDPNDAPNTKLWSFYAGDALEIEITSTTGEVDTLVYSYGIDGNTMNIFGDAPYAPAAGDVRGEYWVDVLDKEFLKMTKRKHPDGSTDGAFLRKELVKQ